MSKFPLRFGSLRIRILAWSFIPTAIILLAIALVILYAYQQVTEDLIAGKNREVVRLSASQVSSDLLEYTGTLASLAQNPDIRLGIDSLQRIALARAHNNLDAFNAGVVILDSHGRVNAAEPPRPETIAQDWSDRPIFRVARDSKRPVYSDITSSDQGPVLIFAVAIVGDQDAFRGVVTGMMRLDSTTPNAFYKRLASMQSGIKGNTLLVDSTGSVLYSAEPAHVLNRNLRSEPAVVRALAGDVGNLRTRDEAGNDQLVSFAPVPGTAWGLIIEENWSGLLEASQGYGRFLLALLALGVVIPTLVVTLGVKRITDPISKLNRAAQGIAGGNFGQQINVDTCDELEQLVAQFNVMSAQLCESYAQLEQRVEIRTRDLRILNDMAAVVSGTLDLKEIMNAALLKAMEALSMDVGTAYSLQEDEGPVPDKYLVLAARQGLSPEFSRQIGLRRVRQSGIRVAAETLKPVVWLLADYPDPEVKQALEAERVRQVINVPLLAKGKFVGAFNLGTREPREILPDELSLLSAIGQQVALAVENAHLYDRAEQSAALAERARLARELHDSVTQSLYSVTMYAEAAQLLITAGNSVTAAEHLRELRDTAREALGEMRLLIYELRPLALEKRGWEAALQERLETVEVRGGIKTELTVEGAERLPVGVQQELYHIAREALNNVIKHGHAHCVHVHLTVGEHLAGLEIGDDGAGFDPAHMRGGLGFAGMRERVQRIGGKLEITSAEGKGTQIKVEVPL